MSVPLTRPGISYVLMMVAAVAVFMDYLDSSIVAIALPEIAADYGVTGSASSWVLISYLLSIGCSLVIFGKLADRSGRYKLVFTSGFVLFTLSSLICGLAPSLLVLVVFRFVQGFSAALMVSTATTIINLHLPANLQSVATGVIATGGGIALAAGPGIGGLLTDFLSWHWVFYINIPIGILGIIGAILLIPRDKPVEKPKTRFDSVGAALLAITLVSLLFGLEFGSQENWPWYAVLLICIAPVFGFFFIRRELHHTDPVLSARLLLSRTVMFASLSTMFTTVAYFGIIFILPFYFTLSGYPTYLSGLLILIPSLCFALSGIPSGILAVKFGCRTLCSLGTIILTAGLAVLIIGMWSALELLLILGLVIVGIGAGLNEGPSIRRITIHSPENLQGSAGGLVFTMMNVGCVLGVSLFSVSAVFASGSTEYTIFGTVIACLVGAGFALAAYITSQLANDTIKS